MPHDSQGFLHPVITSTRNERVKQIAALRDARTRREEGLILVEGEREITRAAAAGFQFCTIVVCPGKLSPNARKILEYIGKDTEILEVAEEPFAKIALREDRDGIVVVAKAKRFSLPDSSDKALWLVVENVEKPGNLGAMIRTADGAGADAIICLDQTVDVFNPNCIRASIGACFHKPVLSMAQDDFLNLARQRGMQVVAAALSNRSINHAAVDYRKPTALLMGSEAFGLSANLLQEADAVVKIPMLGIGDSLNVSVSAGILLYEAQRQRDQAQLGSR
jgi:TrmH family RNA methyltransferase